MDTIIHFTVQISEGRRAASTSEPASSRQVSSQVLFGLVRLFQSVCGHALTCTSVEFNSVFDDCTYVS